MDLDKEIARLRQGHRKFTDHDYDERTGQQVYCEGCDTCESDSWPCPTIALCDAYEAAIVLLAEKEHALDFKGGYKKVEEAAIVPEEPDDVWLY